MSAPKIHRPKKPGRALVVEPGAGGGWRSHLIDEHSPGYLGELVRMHKAGRFSRPGLTEITVLHADWCAIYSGGRCNCEPGIVLPGKTQ